MYGDACLVIVRRENGYPLLVFGHDQLERAQQVARVNGCDLVRCVPEQTTEAAEAAGTRGTG